jgi:hypothetical protein
MSELLVEGSAINVLSPYSRILMNCLHHDILYPSMVKISLSVITRLCDPSQAIFLSLVFTALHQLLVMFAINCSLYIVCTSVICPDH